MSTQKVELWIGLPEVEFVAVLRWRVGHKFRGALLFLTPFQNGLTETDAAKGVEKRRPRMAARYFSFPLAGKSSRKRGDLGK